MCLSHPPSQKLFKEQPSAQHYIILRPCLASNPQQSKACTYKYDGPELTQVRMLECVCVCVCACAFVGLDLALSVTQRLVLNVFRMTRAKVVSC